MENKDLNLDMMNLANDHYKENKVSKGTKYSIKGVLDEIIKTAREDTKPLTEKEIKWRKDVKADLDRVINSSVNKHKQEIKGELYKGKSVTKNLSKRTLMIAVLILSGIIGKKAIDYDMTLDTYNYMLNQKAANELSYSDSKEFLNETKSNREKYANYKESLEELDNKDYYINGSRKDGVKNEYFTFDEDSLFNLSEKQIDAIDNATTKEIDEFKGNNK